MVLFQDADLEYDIDDYDALIAPLLAYRRNFVIGSRHTTNNRPNNCCNNRGTNPCPNSPSHH